MPTHVLVNSLGLTHKGSIGISMATLPDVCKTPSPGGPVPLPYPNTADHTSLNNGTKTVSIKGNMIAIKGSEYSVSIGDEPGTAGGVKSSTFKKEASWITYSFDVKMDGENACRHTDKMFHNHQNTVSLGGNEELRDPEKFYLEIDCAETIKSGEWKDNCDSQELCAMVKSINNLQSESKLDLTRPSPSNYMTDKQRIALNWTVDQRKVFNKIHYAYGNNLRRWADNFTNLVEEEGPNSQKVIDKFAVKCRHDQWNKEVPVKQGETVPGGMSPDHLHDAGLGGPTAGPELESGLKWVSSKVNCDVGRSQRSFDPKVHKKGIQAHESCNCDS